LAVAKALEQPREKLSDLCNSFNFGERYSTPSAQSRSQYLDRRDNPTYRPGYSDDRCAFISGSSREFNERCGPSFHSHHSYDEIALRNRSEFNDSRRDFGSASIRESSGLSRSNNSNRDRYEFSEDRRDFISESRHELNERSGPSFHSQDSYRSRTEYKDNRRDFGSASIRESAWPSRSNNSNRDMPELSEDRREANFESRRELNESSRHSFTSQDSHRNRSEFNDNRREREKSFENSWHGS